MRPFVSLSCSREDDRLAGKRLVRVLITPGENVSNILPELSLGRSNLPWATTTLKKNAVPKPERADRASGPASTKGAVASTTRDAGTSATARTRNACGKSTAGWRLADRLNVARTTRAKAQHAQAEKARRQRAKSVPKDVEKPGTCAARGHAAKFFSPSLMRSAGLLRTPRDLTPQPGTLSAAPPAVRRFATSWTVNVSGSLAALWMAGRSGPSNTRPHAATDPCLSRPLPPMCRPGHLRNDDASRCAGRQLSRRSGRLF